MIIKTETKKQASVCFHCGRDFGIKVFSVINACETPEIALELIEERHFADKCPHCGKMAIAFAYPMYYFDLERNIALVYSPYWQQAKKMANEIVPVPIGKNGKRIKIKTFTQWPEFFFEISEYHACLKKRVKKAQEQAKNGCDLSIQPNTYL